MNLLSLFCLLSLAFAAEKQLIQEPKTENGVEVLNNDFRMAFESACQERDELSFGRLYEHLHETPHKWHA